MFLFIILANIIVEESFPPPCLLPESNTFLPHVVLGNECLPLSKHIMTPYTVGDLLQDTRKGIYNKIHCQALEVTGYAFALMAHKFTFFRKRNSLDYATTEIITKACCCLHNFIRLKELSRNNAKVDENAIKESSEDASLQPLKPYAGPVSVAGKEVRENFLAHFLSQSSVATKQGSLSPLPLTCQEVRKCISPNFSSQSHV